MRDCSSLNSEIINNKGNTNKKSKLKLVFYSFNPRMVPDLIIPVLKVIENKENNI